METVTYQKNQVVCRAGETDNNLYKIVSGRLLICKTKETMVTPVAYLSEGSYIGEFSYFDNATRSAHIIAMEDTELLIFNEDQKRNLPEWLIQTFKDLILKIRVCDSAIAEKGVKKGQDGTKPLSIDEQRDLYQIITGD